MTNTNIEIIIQSSETHKLSKSIIIENIKREYSEVIYEFTYEPVESNAKFIIIPNDKFNYDDLINYIIPIWLESFNVTTSICFNHDIKLCLIDFCCAYQCINLILSIANQIDRSFHIYDILSCKNFIYKIESSNLLPENFRWSTNIFDIMTINSNIHKYNSQQKLYELRKKFRKSTLILLIKHLLLKHKNNLKMLKIEKSKLIELDDIINIYEILSL